MKLNVLPRNVHSSHGWVIINKPVGMTSMKAVILVKRAFGIKKAGHAGTLDPLAYGVLPIALGEATKLIPFAMDKTKIYRFKVVWGEERSTDDLEGEVTRSSPLRPQKQEVENILSQFQGTIVQKPPAFSAIKIEGKRAFLLARQGKNIENEIKERNVDIYSLILLSHDQNTSFFEAHVSKGTYIRSIARDMGRVLGCYGYVVDLQRLQVGSFDLSIALTEEMLYNTSAEVLRTYLLPSETVLDDISALAISAEEAAKFQQGQIIPLKNHFLNVELVKVYADGYFLGLGRLSEGKLFPKRVLNLYEKE